MVEENIYRKLSYGGSKHRGTPTSSKIRPFSIDTWFWGFPILWNHHLWKVKHMFPVGLPWKVCPLRSPNADWLIWFYFLHICQYLNNIYIYIKVGLCFSKIHTNLIYVCVYLIYIYIIYILIFSTSLYSHMYIHICICVCICKCIYVYLHICICVCMYVYIYIYLVYLYFMFIFTYVNISYVYLYLCLKMEWSVM